jgi:molybdopterin converting factor subunit 1
MALPAGAIRILYFAWLRERVGLGEEILVPPSGVETISQLIGWLRGRDSRHEAAFAQEGVIRCAVNQEFQPVNARIAPGDEVAFFPPVTGG